MTDTITIPVPQELAEAFNRADAATRSRIELLVGGQLERYLVLPRRSIFEVMDALSAEAEANGFTEEELADIMREYKEERRNAARQP